MDRDTRLTLLEERAQILARQVEAVNEMVVELLEIVKENTTNIAGLKIAGDANVEFMAIVRQTMNSHQGQIDVTLKAVTALAELIQ